GTGCAAPVAKVALHDRMDPAPCARPAVADVAAADSDLLQAPALVRTCRANGQTRSRLFSHSAFFGANPSQSLLKYAQIVTDRDQSSKRCAHSSSSGSL